MCQITLQLPNAENARKRAHSPKKKINTKTKNINLHTVPINNRIVYEILISFRIHKQTARNVEMATTISGTVPN